MVNRPVFKTASHVLSKSTLSTSERNQERREILHTGNSTQLPVLSNFYIVILLNKSHVNISFKPSFTFKLFGTSCPSRSNPWWGNKIGEITFIEMLLHVMLIVFWMPYMGSYFLYIISNNSNNSSSSKLTWSYRLQSLYLGVKIWSRSTPN